MIQARSVFKKWSALEDADAGARRALGRPDADVSWLLGAQEDMRDCIDDDMSPDKT